MQLRWARHARQDLLDIADHHDSLSAGLAETMLERIETAPLLLLDHPFAGPPVPETELRKWRARGTPFILLYRVRRDFVEVARVVHSATDWRPA